MYTPFDDLKQQGVEECKQIFKATLFIEDP
jgi:hypothetical protein